MNLAKEYAEVRHRRAPRPSTILLACLTALCAYALAPWLDHEAKPDSIFITNVAAQDAALAQSNNETCDSEPRPFSDLEALAKSKPGAIVAWEQGTPIATPSLPSNGEPADPATIAAVTAAIEDAVACINAGDVLRLTALWSDNYLQQQMGGLRFDSNAAEALATPQPIPEVDRTELLGIEDVRIMPDERVAAEVRTTDATSLVVFVNSTGGYLIDASYTLSRVGTPTP